MLEIDYGLAGSGKSRYIKNMLARKLEQGKKLMILVPDQHSFITERSVLEDFGVQDGAKIKVIWFNNLARTITEQYGGVKPQLLDTAGKAILMSKAVGMLGDQLSFYKKQASKPDFVAGLLNLSTEIKYSKTDLQALLQAGAASGSGVLERKIAELTMICRQYDDLVRESYLNPDDVLNEVYALLNEHRFFEGYTVAIDGFGFFDNQKLDIIAQIIRQSEETYVTLCTDSLALSDADGDKFAAVKKTAQRLIEAARDVGSDIQTRCFDDLSALRPEFEALSRGIYTPAAQATELESDRVELFSCANVQQECECAAVRIKQLIMSGNYRYKDIALIVRDEAKFLPPLKRAFAALDIPFFKDKRREIAHEPLILFCHFALKACADGFRLDDVMSCIKSAAVGLETQELSLFENYCLLWNIQGKKKWSSDFIYNPRGFTERFEDEDKALLEQINQTRKKIIVPLLAFAKSIKGATVEQISSALYALLVRVNAAENLKRLVEASRESNPDILEQQSAVWTAFMHCLEQFVATRGEEVLGVKEYLSVLDLAVAGINIGVLPQRMDEILVGSADRIRTDMPKAAFLLGANEGAFPLAFSDGGILNDYERISLLKQGIELGVNCTSMTTQERFFAYCAALAPSEYLYLSYSQSDLDGNLLSPSSFIGEIRRILPHLAVKEGETLLKTEVLTPEQGFYTLTALWNEDSTLRQSLYALYSRHPQYKDKIRQIEQTLHKEQRAIDNPKTALKLFGEIMAISPTQLETYSKCPFMYFCKYGLNAKASEQAALDARTGGTLIHYVLEHIVREIGKQGIIALSRKQLREYTDTYIRQYLEELNLPEEFVSGRFLYLVSKNRNIILSTLEQMAAEMRQSDFVPAAFEFPLGQDEKSAYKVALTRGEVRLRGTVDRVDTMQKNESRYFRVIDYKTGSKEFKLGEVLHGINAQMLIYLLALSKGESDYRDSVPAGLLYINAADKPISASHGADSYIQGEREKRYKMNGMLLNEHAVIEGMEHEPSGKFIPISVKKSGQISGHLVSTEQMEKIREKLDAVIADMGNSLHEGKIDDMPAKTAAFNACEWCDYKAICRNRDKQRQLKVPSFEKALKELEGGEADE